MINDDRPADVGGQIAQEIDQVVHKGPDATAAERQEFHNAEPDLAPIKPVAPERTEKGGKEDQDILADVSGIG